MAGGLMATGLALSACGLDDSPFENREGDIVAGEPVTVLEVWHNRRSTGKHGPSGYVLYLVTEDCEDGATPAPGPVVGIDCENERHRVDASTFKNSKDGDTIYWEGGDGPSEVTEHRYGRDSYYATVYDFGLLVRQCLKVTSPVPQQRCTEDFVDVSFDTWYSADQGDIITFAGEKGEVVSD